METTANNTNLRIPNGNQPLSLKPPLSFQMGILLTLPFFLYALSITFLDQAVPPKYTPLRPNEILAQLPSERWLDNDIDIQTVENFLQTPNAEAVYGRNLYPRFFWQNHGLDRNIYLSQPYPRLAFTVLGERGAEQVLLPFPKSPKEFIHGENVIVIGCYKIGHSRYGDFSYIDALLVADMDNAIYVRNPADPLAFKCPLPEPE